MGEIRSTLDIIMEKTKDLTPTEEEKKAFRKNEVKGEVRGLLLKVADGRMSQENFNKRINALEEKDPGIAAELVIKECLANIDPQSENSLFFEILEHAANMDTTPFKNLLSEFQKDLDREKGLREQGLRKSLHEKGISGSAVLPNIGADRDWIDFVQNKKDEFQAGLQALVER